MGRWLLALVLAAAGLPGAQAREALGSIDACLARLDRSLDVGYQRIAARCPELATDLGNSEWAAWLPRDWNRSDNLLSADGLTELRTLLTRTPVAARTRAPRVTQVATLLAKLTQADAPPAGWWTRFKQWLREILTPQRARAETGWLRRLFGDLGTSEVVLRAIAWGALVLVVALAGAVVVNELRLAGVLGRRKRRAARNRLLAGQPAEPPLLELERAAPSQQPQLLLQLVTTALAEQDRLPPARALTVQELTRAARLPQESDREHLRQLATVCERVRFSDGEPVPQLLAAALRHGRELLAALESASRQPQAAS